MAEQRAPIGIEVNNAYLFVKDPDAAGTELFGGWQRVTGLSSFTMPAEVGGTNETQLMDGTIAFASRTGVGTITGAIGGATPGPVQQFMEQRKLDGRNVQIRIVRLAVNVGTFVQSGTSQFATGFKLTSLNTTDAPRKDSLGDQLSMTDLLKLARADHLIGWDLNGQVAPVSVADALTAVDDATAAMDAMWHSVVSVDDAGGFAVFAPTLSTAQTFADGGALFVRRPGVITDPILGTVNGFDVGDFQQGSAVTGNFTFTPAEAVQRKRPEHRLTLSQSDSTGQYTL